MEFVGLGLHGADAIIENHFHRLPERALHIRDPKKKQRKREERRQKEQGANNDGESESDEDEPSRSLVYSDDQYANEKIPRTAYQPERSNQEDIRNGAAMRTPFQAHRPNVYDDPMTLARRDPGTLTDRYIPADVLAGTSAAATAAAAMDSRYSSQARNPRSDLTHDQYERSQADPHEDYAYIPRRPPSDSTRSHAPRRSRSVYERSRAERSPPEPASARSRRSASRPRRQKSTGIDDLFSGSNYGLGALSVGALAGGYAAYKTGKNNNVDPVLAALAGGAVGALGANAAEKRHEDHKREKEVHVRRSEDRYGDPVSRDRDRDDRGRKGSY